MRVSSLMAACCMLATGQLIFAQGGSQADPISGTWKGDIGLDLTNRMPITLELKFDGKTAVSGTFNGLQEPGEIKSGTFDTTTGALKLGLGKIGDSAVLLTFEGTALGGTATGRVTGENKVGSFIITQPARAGAAAAAAPPAGSDTAALRAGFDEVSGWIAKSAELVPAEKYSYRPTPAVRTYGQLIAHVADGQNYYCARASGRQVQWSDAIEKGSSDKAVVIEKLKQSIAACAAVYGSGGERGQMMANIAHSNLHYGNIITYIRMLGLVPPSSQ